jgi:prolyl oligopeptidase
MIWLVLRALSALFAYDVLLGLKGFPGLYWAVERIAVAERSLSRNKEQEILKAIDVACGLYPKRALCLQRSAITVYLLRKHGLRASLVIGATRLPFRAHAWVESEGRVVNDRSEVQEMYGILSRS